MAASNFKRILYRLWPRRSRTKNRVLQYLSGEYQSQTPFSRRLGSRRWNGELIRVSFGRETP
jgi:hypothetical protein